MTLYLGVDGGGTKTDFTIIEGRGTILTQARRGTTYHLQIGLEETVARLRDGIAAACGALGIGPDSLAFVFLGLPAHGESAAADPILDAACGDILGHRRYALGNDMVCGWAGSLGGQDGINIVAGTGSIGYGERGGHSARVGGWGELIGDEGSAYWIGRQALAVFTRMSDGRAPRGPLHPHVARELGIARGRDIDLIARVMGPPPMSRERLAAFAPVVVAAAESGDPAAAAILDAASLELASLATALRTTLGFAPGEQALISWSGGVLREIKQVRDRFAAAMADAGGFELVAPRHDPAYGAALYARRLAQTQSLAPK